MFVKSFLGGSLSVWTRNNCLVQYWSDESEVPSQRRDTISWNGLCLQSFLDGRFGFLDHKFSASTIMKRWKWSLKPTTRHCLLKWTELYSELRVGLFIYVLKAYSPVNRTESPQSFFLWVNVCMCVSRNDATLLERWERTIKQLLSPHSRSISSRPAQRFKMKWEDLRPLLWSKDYLSVGCFVKRRTIMPNTHASFPPALISRVPLLTSCMLWSDTMSTRH